MRVRRAAVVVVSVAAASAWADPPEALRIDATDAGGLKATGPVEIHVAPDGAAQVTQRAYRSIDPAVSLALKLTDEEMIDLRRRVVESKFFDDWGPDRPPPTDAGAWDVTIALGAAAKRRPCVSVEPRFDPVARFLWKLVAQAEAQDAVARGGAVGVAHRLQYATELARLLRPDSITTRLGPALVKCAIDAKKPYDAGEAALVLVDFTTAEQFAGAVTTILSKLDGDRRDAVLSVWAGELAKPNQAALRAAFAPTALAETRASWSGWEKWPRVRTDMLRALLSMSLRERVPGALAVAEEKIRELSTDDRPFLVGGLTEIGVVSAPLALRLLDDEKPALRAAGAELSQFLASASKPSRGAGALSDADRATLSTRMTDEVAPALERRVHADGEALFVREACFRALDVWNGRDRRAEERGKAAESAKKRDAVAATDRDASAQSRAKAEQWRPPKGESSIAGRLLGAGDAPLGDILVVVYRDDGPPDAPRRFYGSAKTAADGAFRIDGLVEGAFAVAAMPGDRWVAGRMGPNTSTQEGVRAGSSEVALRFAGSMLRGRALDEAGRPVARLSLRADMRDAPTRLDGDGLSPNASAETAADGRFRMLQLLPGVYDIDVPAHPLVAGATGVVAGAGEITIVFLVGASSVAGRVVDERGAPLAGAGVGATPVGSMNGTIGGKSDESGAFRIDGLDPSLRYDVVAALYDRPPTAHWTAALKDVAPGATGLLIRIDTGPRVDVRVDFGSRATRAGPTIRVVRDGDGEPREREFHGKAVLWRAAPQATWRVLANVRDLDAHGDAVDVWIELGTVTTGDPEKTFVVPR